jgi:hypothetical protein
MAEPNRNLSAENDWNAVAPSRLFLIEAILPALQVGWMFPMTPFDAEEGGAKKNPRAEKETAILVGSKNSRPDPENIGVGFPLA